MKHAIILAAPGFVLKTGYYYRVVRDAELLRNSGKTASVIIFTAKGFFSESGQRLRFFDTLRKIRNAELLFLENISASLFLYLHSRRAGKSIIVVHGSLDELSEYKFPRLKTLIYSIWLHNAVQNCDLVISVSNALTKYLLEEFNGQLNAIKCIPNLPNSGFNEKIVKLWKENDIEKTRISLNLNPKRKYLCYSGNAQTWQKVDILMETFAKLQKAAPDFDLIILTRDKIWFTNKATQLKIPSERLIIKEVNNNQVPNYLFASDILYLIRDESNINKVACPTKAMEYLLSGRPIIVSENLGDISAFIKHRKNGVVISQKDSSDPRVIAKKIQAIGEAHPNTVPVPNFKIYDIANYADIYEKL